MVVQKTRKGKF